MRPPCWPYPQRWQRKAPADGPIAEGSGGGKGGPKTLRSGGSTVLDGKTFTITLTEKGKEEGDPDTLIFKDATFDSTACHEYGFLANPYMAKEKDGGVKFMSICKSKKSGTNVWKGPVSGDEIKGTPVWNNGEKN